MAHGRRLAIDIEIHSSRHFSHIYPSTPIKRTPKLTPKRIPFFEPYAWLARDVFHSLPGASPCIHATWAISSCHDASLVSRWGRGNTVFTPRW